MTKENFGKYVKRVMDDKDRSDAAGEDAERVLGGNLWQYLKGRVDDEDFNRHVKRVMDDVVRRHKRPDEGHRLPKIESSKRQRWSKYLTYNGWKGLDDDRNRRSAFVMSEQMGSKPIIVDGRQELRYSLWFVENLNEPIRIYTDIGLRPELELGDHPSTDARIHLDYVLEDGVIAEIITKDEESPPHEIPQKVKIKLDGKIEEPERFEYQAENLVKRIHAGPLDKRHPIYM